MADQSPQPDTGRGAHTESGGSSPPRAPRWVWVSLAVVGVLAALAVVALLVSGGEHGPGRHTSLDAISPTGTAISTSLTGTHP